MNWVRIIQVTNIVISFGFVIYMLVDITIKSTMLKRKNIKNSKYIVLIVILCILFVIYGIMRNFE